MESLRERTFKINTDIIITFFTDIYYNRIHIIAQDDFARNGGTSMTDTYARSVKIYMSSIEQAKQELRDTIAALHTYYCKYAGEHSLSGFIASIVAQIIPEEFFSTMDDRERDAVFRDLIKQIVISMGKRVLRGDLLRNVIDEREKFETGITILRGEGEKVIRDFKASLISKLYSKNGDGDKSMRVVAAEQYDKVRKELVNALTEVCTLQVENERLKDDKRKLTRIKDDMAKKLSLLITNFKELQEKLTIAQQPTPQVVAIAPKMSEIVREAPREVKPEIVREAPREAPHETTCFAKPEIVREVKKSRPAKLISPPLDEPTDEDIDQTIAEVEQEGNEDFAEDEIDDLPIDTHTLAQQIAKKRGEKS